VDMGSVLLCQLSWRGWYGHDRAATLEVMDTPQKSFKIIAVLGAMLLLGMLSLGCASSKDGRSGSGQSASSDNELVVGLAEAGTVIELRVGQILLVDLPESPSSGRVWQLIRRPDQMVIMPDGNRFEQTDEQKARKDLIGMQHLRFEAVGIGEAILTLALVRPGTGVSTSDDRWMGQIRVR
jgi:predicted secreted protein